MDARPASRNRSRGIPYDDPDRREARGEGVALGQSVGARDGRSGVGQIDFRPRRSPWARPSKGGSAPAHLRDTGQRIERLYHDRG